MGCATLLYCQLNVAQEKKEYTINTIAFYNLENLFDTVDDPTTFDDDKTPEGKDHWTQEFYENKIQNMAKVISDIGQETAKNTPVIIGVAEIENRKVLEDLINTSFLSLKDYGIIHFDSPDRRGIDVGLLYQKKLFIPKNSTSYPLKIYDKQTNERVYTRDQLVVSGYLDGDLIHIIVNHWPSRRGGEQKSSYKREAAARLNKKIMDSLFAENPYAKIISMGDFNDNPDNNSVKEVLNVQHTKQNLQTKMLYTPMAKMMKKGMGSLAWGDQWFLFDQMILSSSLLTTDYSTYAYYQSGIFSPDYLRTPSGKYEGYPFRSFNRGQYTFGYSDHFPVYLYLIKAKR